MRIRNEKILEDLEFSDKFKMFEIEYDNIDNNEINDFIEVCIEKIKQNDGKDI